MHKELIDVIKDHEHRFGLETVHTVFVVRIAKHSDLVELVPKHVAVLDIVEIDEKVDFEDTSLDEVGC